MDLKNQIIAEYLTQGCGFRQLAAKYGISSTTYLQIDSHPHFVAYILRRSIKDERLLHVKVYRP